MNFRLTLLGVRRHLKGGMCGPVFGLHLKFVRNGPRLSKQFFVLYRKGVIAVWLSFGCISEISLIGTEQLPFLEFSTERGSVKSPPCAGGSLTQMIERSLCCLLTQATSNKSAIMPGMPKVRPAGRLRSAKKFIPARVENEILAYYQSYPRLP